MSKYLNPEVLSARKGLIDRVSTQEARLAQIEATSKKLASFSQVQQQYNNEVASAFESSIKLLDRLEKDIKGGIVISVVSTAISILALVCVYVFK